VSFFQELSALSFVFVLFSSHYLFFLVLAVFFQTAYLVYGKYFFVSILFFVFF